MFQRGQRPASSSSTAPEEAFTLDVEDLYAENSISAAVAVTLLAKGTQAGVAANPSFASRSTKKNFLKNAARTMRNRKLKGSQWPDLYWFSNLQLFEKTISCFKKRLMVYNGSMQSRASSCHHTALRHVINQSMSQISLMPWEFNMGHNLQQAIVTFGCLLTCQSQFVLWLPNLKHSNLFAISMNRIVADWCLCMRELRPPSCMISPWSC